MNRTITDLSLIHIFGPEPGGPIGPPEALGGVVQLGCGDEQGLRRGEISGSIDDGDAVFGRGKADPLELAMELGQEVGPGEGEMCIRDR